jgi:hypothetical protein
MTHSGFRLQPGMTSGSYADQEGSRYHLARDRPCSVLPSSKLDLRATPATDANQYSIIDVKSRMPVGTIFLKRTLICI